MRCLEFIFSFTFSKAKSWDAGIGMDEPIKKSGKEYTEWKEESEKIEIG